MFKFEVNIKGTVEKCQETTHAIDQQPVVVAQVVEQAETPKPETIEAKIGFR